MKGDKIAQFMQLAGQKVAAAWLDGDEAQRKLGAQLLLSEVLEYVIHGLGVTPVVNGTPINEPNNLRYQTHDPAPDREAMLDGLADVAYTMYWNACAFGVPLEDAFDLVCDNNLTKFVRLPPAAHAVGPLEREEWHLGLGIEWPKEVVQVEILRVADQLWAVGKDASGKVRKPSSYRPVELAKLL